MKQFEIKAERVIDGNKFFIRPLPAFKSANLSGDLAALIIPILTAVAPLAGENLMDVDAAEAAPAMASGLSGVSGDKIELMLKKLLVTYNNVSVQPEGKDDAQYLTEDLANEIFCGEVQDMFILAFEVIKSNFNGFFKKLGGQFGGRLNEFLEKV
jgi:hypothetical protein